MERSPQTKLNTLKIEQVCKYFAGLKAVDGVSLELQTGEILGLIGPNGSGKTTLINVITGLLPATAGKMLVDNIDITRRPAYQVAQAGIARTFQTIRLFKELTVLENAAVAGVSTGLTRAQSHLLGEQLLTELGLEGMKERLAGELSYGNQRKLEIARALAMRPKFLLLDEPAAGLNEDESDLLLEMLKSIPAKKSVGMLIVDHDMRLIMRLCDRLHVLNYGKTIAEGKPAEVRSNPAVINAYLGKSR